MRKHVSLTGWLQLCVILLMISAFSEAHAGQTRVIPALSQLTSSIAAQASNRPAPPASRVKLVHRFKEDVTQDFLDDLAAGKPRTLWITFLHPDVDAQVAMLKQQRHLVRDDAEVRAFKVKQYSALKKAALSGFGSDMLQVVEAHENYGEVVVRVHDLRTLQRIIDNPRVSHVNSPVPVTTTSGTVFNLPGSPSDNWPWQQLIQQPTVFNDGWDGTGIVIGFIDAADDVATGHHQALTVMPTPSSSDVAGNCRYYFPECQVAADNYCYATNDGASESAHCNNCTYQTEKDTNDVDYQYMQCGSLIHAEITCGDSDVNDGGGEPPDDDDFIKPCYVQHQMMVADAAAGVAPKAKFDMTTLADSPSAPMDDFLIANALEWVRANETDVSVINISLASVQLDGSIYSSQCDSQIPEESVLQELHADNIVVVAAAGNAGAGITQGPAGLTAPACSNYVISVGAVMATPQSASAVGACNRYGGTEPADTMPCFSDYAPFMTITAPGAGFTYDPLAAVSGTSFASPIVAGGVALIQQVHPDTPNAIESELVNHSDNATAKLFNGTTVTVPRINLLKSISAAISGNQGGGGGSGGGGSGGGGSGSPPPPTPAQLVVTMVRALLLP